MQAKDQLALDEKVIDDSELETALEALHAARGEAGEANKRRKDALDTAKTLAGRLELPDGMAARVGRFRISRQDSKARTVHFTTDPKTRYVFDLAAGDDEHVSATAEADDSAKAAERRLRAVN